MKRFRYSTIARICTLLALCTQPCPDAYARHLQPEEALSMLGSVQHRSAPQSPLRLAYSQAAPDGAESAVYVFNREDAPGFYVLAADDAVGDIRLGYSHTGYFSADNIAPGMKWLLDAYSATVSSYANAGAPASHREAPPVLHKVEPLMTTMWNQDTPYNDMCPQLFGNKSFTGGVATALAQIMKVHQWPISGTGSQSYSYTLNDSTVEISSDFSSHAYDWANMLDEYTPSGTYSQEQKDAVSQLMFDCGVASNTTYTTQICTATSMTAATGMLEYLGYDKSMMYLKREWFSDRDWHMLLHSQISQGMPVFYSGQGHESNNIYDGHAFVLDGYDGEGYFHINWGWGGLSDGYYSLENISPTYIGVGGGFDSFNMQQEALVGIRPSEGNSLTPNFALSGTFCTDKSSYTLGAELVTFMSGTPGGGFFSYTPLTVNAEIGIMNTLDGNVVSIGMYSIATLRGFGNFGFDCRYFPEGEYDVFPVFKTEDGEWTPMRYDPSVTSGRLHFKRDQTILTVENVVVPNPQITCSFVSSTTDDCYYQGESYTVTYRFKVNEPCATTLTLLVQDHESTVICESEPVEATFAEGEYEKTFHITIPENVTPGEYYFGMMCVDEDGIMMWTPNRIIDVREPVIEATAVTLNVTEQQLTVDESFILLATVMPENTTDKTVTWSTSDPLVATVDTDGRVTAITPGTAVITATCGSVSDRCIVSVVEPVRIAYNGRYISIEADTDYDEIRYSLDGSDPTEGTAYTDVFDVHGLHTVRAVAFRNDHTSYETVLEIRGYADETHAETAEGGQLESCYGWADSSMLQSLQTLRVEGYLNDADFAFIRSMPNLRNLDISRVNDAHMPSSALARTQLVTVSMPAELAEYGDGIFSGCSDLCAIIWNSEDASVEPRLKSGAGNPNLLLYVQDASLAANAGIANTVASDYAASIVLTDGYPFNAPLAFTAAEITYTRHFSKLTPVAGCSGWESITLPFDVQSIHDDTGEVKPFEIARAGERPFWLYEPDGNGWQPSSGMMAYRPYLISMPNNPGYYNYYNIRGNVAFRASNATIGITPEAEGFAYTRGMELWPSFSRQAADNGKLLINDDAFEGYVPGSVFIDGLRDVRPFECYLTSPSGARRVPVFDNSGVDDSMALFGMKVWTEDHTLCILSGIDRTVRIFDIEGHLVRMVELEGGTVCRITDLPRGFYFVEHEKVLVR